MTIKTKNNKICNADAQLLENFNDRNNSSFYISGQQYSKEVLLKIAKRNLDILLDYDFDEEFIIAAISSKSNKGTTNVLRTVKNQTEAICLAAIKSNGSNFKYVNNKTPAICMAAVISRGSNLALITNQTEELCMAALKMDDLSAFQFIKNKTEKIINDAFDKCSGNCTFIEHIDNLSDRDAIRALDLNELAYLSFNNPPSDVVLNHLIQINPSSIRSFPFRQTKEMILDCMNNYIACNEFWYKSLSPNGMGPIQLFIEAICPGVMDDEFYEKLVMKNGLLLASIKQRTPQIELLAVQQNWRALAYASELTEEICVAAYEQDVRAIRIMWNEYAYKNGINYFTKFELAVNQFIDKKLFESDEFLREIAAFDTQKNMEVIVNNHNTIHSDAVATSNVKSRKRIDHF